METKKALRLDLASLQPYCTVPRSQTTRSFKELMGFCEDMKDDIEMTWELAKVESISRCNTLDNLYKKSIVRHGNDWKLMPEYNEMRVRLAEHKQTAENTTWARQVDEVKNLLGFKKTKKVLVKNISNLHMKRLISRCKRKFGEALHSPDMKPDLYRAKSQELKRQGSIEEVLMDEEKKQVFLTEAESHLLSTKRKLMERSLTARQLTPEWDYDKLSDKNRVVFERKDRYLYNNRKVFLMRRQKALDCKMRMIKPSEDIRRKAEWLVNHTPSMGSSKSNYKFKQKFSVSSTSSPKIVRHQQTEEELYLQIEVEKEFMDLKARLNIARYVTDKRRKDKLMGREAHKIISPSGMKLLTKL